MVITRCCSVGLFAGVSDSSESPLPESSGSGREGEKEFTLQLPQVKVLLSREMKNVPERWSPCRMNVNTQEIK